MFHLPAETLGGGGLERLGMGVREDLDPQSLKKKALVFYCIEVLPKCLLEDNKTWPEGTALTMKLFTIRSILQKGG
jgi:hypothetical protein